jgi:hypothetical protein
VKAVVVWETSLTRVVTLPVEPTEDHYEHLAAAFLAAGGYFVEKNIRERVESRDFQELDVCGWRWAEGRSERVVVEVKSGDWGKKELFAILGRRVYLGCERGLLIHRRQEDPDPIYLAALERMRPFGIAGLLLDPSESPEAVALAIAKTCGGDAEQTIARVVSLASLPAWRYCFWLEKQLVGALAVASRGAQSGTCLDEAKSLLEQIHSRFFVSDCRVQSVLLWSHYREHPKLTRRLVEEAHRAGARPGFRSITEREAYAQCAFGGVWPVAQACLYLENWARCLVLRAAVETALLRARGELPDPEARGFSIDDLLPDYFDEFCRYVSALDCAERLPQLWQTYVFTWGGFLIEDAAEAEMQRLATEVEMPLDSVRLGLEAFDKLFPGVTDGWHASVRGTGIRVLKMVPAAFRGLGVQRRRWLDGDEPFKRLPARGGQDCVKWSEAAIALLAP